MMKKYLKLIRIHHWIKNLLIFLPIVFNRSIFDLSLLGRSVFGFFTFSVVCSFIYVINDIQDIDKDRQHSTKKFRPLPSGELSIRKAYVVSALLFLLGISGCIFLIVKGYYTAIFVLILYILINLFYSYRGKNIPILDIFLLMSGFIIRILFGSFITGIEISDWMYLTTICGAFYLGLGKRRNELATEVETRAVLAKYTHSFLDKSMTVCLSLTLAFYSLWCVETDTYRYLVFTVPLVMAIFFKYSLNIEKSGDGDPVEVVIHDKVLIFLIILFGISILGILYGNF